jgi:hypothetical protein
MDVTLVSQRKETYTLIKLLYLHESAGREKH